MNWRGLFWKLLAMIDCAAIPWNPEGASPMNSVVEPIQPSIDMSKLQGLMGRALIDFSAAMQSALVVLGDRLGLYRVLAHGGAMTPDQLARQSGTTERYVREWLNANAASGYVDYTPESERYSMTPEQRAVFADADSPAFIVGGFETALAAVKVTDRLEQAFRTGEGIGWHEHHHQLFHGCERFYRSGYGAHLVQEWIPALHGMQARLTGGARVADVGCGHGASTLLLARAFPNSSFVGYDIHAESVEVARDRARQAGVDDRVHFEVASAQDYPGRDFDLVMVFDALHDMGDPIGAAAHTLKTLKDDGLWMIVEPNAADRVEENLNPVGRAFYAGSTLMCVPCALKQGRTALGAQAGEARLREVMQAGGFRKIRRVASTPFNLVLEART
jgi:2-polyprenyl-3-methyl-5-hydroxy-6-metoxy-1,4-benzoquinol methylase